MGSVLVPWVGPRAVAKLVTATGVRLQLDQDHTGRADDEAKLVTADGVRLQLLEQ